MTYEQGITPTEITYWQGITQLWPTYGLNDHYQNSSTNGVEKRMVII